MQPVSGPLDATVRPPGSKSLTNRALVCAALADGSSTLTGALDSEDTRVMAAALAQLGISVKPDWPQQRIEVTGCGGQLPTSQAELYVANSGTTVRFLTALVALGNGRFRLDGTERMRERPIDDLLAALAQLAVKARSERGTGCPPVIIDAAGLAGGRATVRGDVSSQFLSGLLMAAPYARGTLELAIEGKLVSQPYVHMTRAVMESFGIRIEAAADLQRFEVPPAHYRGRDYAIEPDASAASYFWAAAAICGGSVTVSGLGRDSLQGDVAFCDCLEQMGCRVMNLPRSIASSGTEVPGGIQVTGGALRGIDVDMNGISDTVQTLSAVALFAEGPTTVRGVGHIRHKETDRIGALATELRKLGAHVDEYVDGLRIVPGQLRPAALDTYRDHRMAMSLALVGLRQPGIVINDPGCTAKTYPRFFEDLARVCRQGA
jgi:3-phosphoshikimate 1-carboxyvinyltransferase